MRPAPAPPPRALGLVGLIVLTACQAAAPGPAARLELVVRPLDLPGIDFACYDLRVADEDGAPVVTLGDPAASLLSDPADDAALCSTRYGNGAGGDLTYIAPCDASRPSHTVTLWVDGLYRGTPAAPIAVEHVDPCPSGCTLEAVCEENADTLIVFDLTIMRPAGQGFFDIAVELDDVFCSAKVDCVRRDETDAPLDLLHHPATGERDQTVVLALACASGEPGTDTVMLWDHITVDCSGTETLVDPTAGPGQLYTAATPDPRPDDAIWQVATYLETSTVTCAGAPCELRAWNVAIGFDPARPDCRLTARATAGDASTLPGFSTPDAAVYPLIDIDVDLTHPAGGLACSRHALDGEPSGVATGYTAPDVPATLCSRLAGGLVTSDCPPVANLAALRAVTAPGPDIVDVLTHTSAGDEGGGVFRWDPASTAGDDDAIVVRPDGWSGPGRWVRQYGGPLHTAWFGVARDGLSDDCADLQRALDRGEDLVFDPGVYAVGCELLFEQSNVTYSGRGEVELRLATPVPGRLARIRGDDLTWRDLAFTAGGDEVQAWLVRIEPDTLRPRFLRCRFGDIAGTKRGGGNETNLQYALLVSLYGVEGFAFDDCTFADITNENLAPPYDATTGIGLGFAGAVFFNEEALAQPTDPQVTPTSGRFEGCLFEDIQTILPLGLGPMTDRNDADGIRFYGEPGAGHRLPVVIRDSTFRRISKRAIKGSVATGQEIYDVVVDARGLPQPMVTGIKVEAGMIVDGVDFFADPEMPIEVLFQSHNIANTTVTDVVADHARRIWNFAPTTPGHVTDDVTVDDVTVTHLHDVGFSSSNPTLAVDDVVFSNLDLTAAPTRNAVVAFLGPFWSTGRTELTIRDTTLTNMDVKLEGDAIRVERVTLRIIAPPPELAAHAFVGSSLAYGLFQLTFAPGSPTTNVVDTLDVDARGLGPAYQSRPSGLVTFGGDDATYGGVTLEVSPGTSTADPHVDVYGSGVTFDGLTYLGTGYAFVSTTSLASHGPYGGTTVRNWTRTSSMTPPPATTTRFIYANGGQANTMQTIRDLLPGTAPTIQLVGGFPLDPSPYAYIVSDVWSRTTHPDIVQHGGLADLSDIVRLPPL